jgi:hypothetical protein
MNELESKYNQFMLEVANFKNELISSDIIEKVKDKFNGFQVLISQLQD